MKTVKRTKFIKQKDKYIEEITIRDFIKGFEDNGINGVFTMNGLLNIRPPWQREMVYPYDKRAAVIETIAEAGVIGLFHWGKNPNGTMDVIDGQQRGISICEFVNNKFAFENRYFQNLSKEEQDIFLDYKLLVSIIDGTAQEKMHCFEKVNTAGMALSPQELRNAIHIGKWLENAKLFFSKPNCPAKLIGSNYISGSVIRQKYLETAIKWHCDSNKADNIALYMAEHQFDNDASELWIYFNNVIQWIEKNFIVYRPYMKSVNWGYLYNRYKDTDLNPELIEEETIKLYLDDDVSKKSGIYPFILTRNKKYLNVRVFTLAMKQKVYEKQEGYCAHCEGHFDIDDMEGDHINPWHEGGETNEDNCQMLCKECNRKKGGN